MKFIGLVFVILLAGCSFEPCAFDQCLDDNPCSNCGDMEVPDQQIEADIPIKIEEDMGVDEGHLEFDMSIEGCVEPAGCGVDNGSPIDPSGNFPFYGCYQFEDELQSRVFTAGEMACNIDRHQVSFRSCENNSFIIEATLIPDTGCAAGVDLSVSGRGFSCLDSNVTKCETLANGTQRIQILVHPIQGDGDVYFVVRRTTETHVGYTLRTSAFQ